MPWIPPKVLQSSFGNPFGFPKGPSGFLQVTILNSLGLPQDASIAPRKLPQNYLRIPVGFLKDLESPSRAPFRSPEESFWITYDFLRTPLRLPWDSLKIPFGFPQASLKIPSFRTFQQIGFPRARLGSLLGHECCMRAVPALCQSQMNVTRAFTGAM